MRHEDHYDSIKENRGDFKFEIARLQSIIMDSTQRPTLAITMCLEIILIIQMFITPFTYLQSMMVNPTWAYLPLFNNFVPAYYLKYLNSFGYLCVLIIVDVLMLIYLLGVVLLIVTSRNSKFSKILAKIIRIKLQMLSTIIFSSILKIVLTVFHCQYPQSSLHNELSQFKCLYDGPKWLSWFSIIILAIFLVILLTQCYVKFEFYAHTTKSSVIKKSQQWIPIILLFHFIIQIITITQTKQTLLIVMNIIPVVMIIHLSFMQQTLTFLYHQTIQSISISLLYLMIFIDVNYLLDIPLSYTFWFFSLALLIPTFLMYPTLSIKYILQNINKWNSANDRLQYASGLRTLLSQPSSIKIISYQQGYSDIHFQKCEQVLCPFRFTKPKLDKIRIFRHNKNLIDAQIKIEQLGIKIFSQGTKFFPNVPAFGIQFAIFLYERNMKQKALKFLLGCQIQNLTIEQYYKFYRLRKVLHQELIKKEQTTLDLLTQMQMRDLEQQFLRSVEKSSLLDIDLWTILLQQHPNFNKLDKIGGERIKIGQKVKNLYNRILQKGNSQRVTSLYVQYLINVCKQNGNFTDVQQRIKNKYNLDNKIKVSDWANSSHPSIIISGQQNTFGEIQDFNLSASILLGYQKSQIINCNLETIVPSYLSHTFQQIVSLKQEKNQFYLLRKDKYIEKVKKTVFLSSSIMKGSIFICTLEPLPFNSFSCKILVQSSAPFNIVGMQSKVISFFGIQVKQNGQMFPILELSQILNNSLLNNQSLQKQYLLSEILTTHILKRMKPTDLQLKQLFQIKIQRKYNNCIEIDFQKRKSTVKFHHTKAPISHFRFEPFILEQNLVYSNNLTSHYKYDQTNNKVQINEQKQPQYQNKIDYGKGIRIVRLDYDQIQIIQQSSESSESQVKSQFQLQNNLGVIIENPIGNQNQNSNILQNRYHLKEFVTNNSVGKNNKMMIAIITLISMMWFIIICFVYRDNHHGIVESLTEYVDENMKIGQIELIHVAVIRSVLFQQGRSSVNLSSLTSKLQQSLDYLQIKKNSGHIYSINTVLLDGSYQYLTNLQFIDSLNANIRDLLISLKNGSTISSSIIEFSIKNSQVVHPQMINHLINWNNSVISNFNHSLMIEIVLIVLFIIVQSCLISFFIFKVYKMFDDKISVLKIFLELSEQNVRIMSIKTQQFLNTLYNNQVDIDDQQTIIRKTNNKHTFAIKKKFKTIKRSIIVFIIIGIICLLLFTTPLTSFSLSIKGLVFKKQTIPFLNYTSSGTSFFYNHLHTLQMNVYKLANTPVPAYQYIYFYRTMMASFYNTFSNDLLFADYWTSVMMQDICNGRAKLQYACQTPSSVNGGIALITDLVLNTLSFYSYANDFSPSYYNYYRVLNSLHKGLSNHVLKVFSTAVSQMQNNLIILLILSLVLTPIFLILIGLKILDRYSQSIDKTRKMLILLPIQYLKKCESIHNYLTQTVNKKQWILF